MHNAKIIIPIIITLVLTSCSARYTEKEKTSLQELQKRIASAKIMEQNARIEREKTEDSLSQALYEECYQSALSGSWRFEIKQKKAFECFKKNNLWTVTSASSEVARRWISPEEEECIKNTTTAWSEDQEMLKQIRNCYQIQNEQSKIWSWSPSPTSPVNRPQSIGTPKAPWKPVAKTLWHWPNVSQSADKNDNWGKSEKGKGKKYWQAYDVAIAQIHKSEWIQLTAYPDYGWWSIGWGTRSYTGEVITQVEADRRLVSIVVPVLEDVRKAYPDESAESQWALVSFAFNCHKGWVDVKRNWLKQHRFWCKTAWGEILDWLVKRRNEESKLIFSK